MEFPDRCLDLDATNTTFDPDADRAEVFQFRDCRTGGLELQRCGQDMRSGVVERDVLQNDAVEIIVGLTGGEEQGDVLQPQIPDNQVAQQQLEQRDAAAATIQLCGIGGADDLDHDAGLVDVDLCSTADQIVA